MGIGSWSEGRRGEREEERGKGVESSPNLVGCLWVILFDAFLWAWFPDDESQSGRMQSMH